MFVWEGLPDGMRPEFIENLLYNYGSALFFKDEKMDMFLCLNAMPSGGQNVYGEFLEYRGMGIGFYDSASYKQHETCVLVRNNAIQTNTREYILMYAARIAEIERTLDVNVKAQKTPLIIACDDKDILSLKNVYKQIDGNMPAIWVDKNLNLGAIQVLNTNAPFICDKLADYKHDVWADAMTFLGIANANTDKRERLVTDEVNANNAFVDMNAAYMLQAREMACEEINRLFGLSVSVEVRKTQTEEEGANVGGVQPS